ncbi:unnamed protein product, partial [Closterium sp. NIES-54]
MVSCADACGNKCGTDAKCDVAADGTGGKCKCLDGSTFNDVDNTCAGGVVVATGFMPAAAAAAGSRGGACTDKECGMDAECFVNHSGAGECQCLDGSTFNNLDNTCDGVVVDPCASSDCGGNGGVCEVNDNGVPECVCTNGLVFNVFDMSCYAPYVQTTVHLQLQALVNGRQRSYADDVNFTTNGPAEQLSGTIVCTDLTSSFSLRGDTKISIGWSSFQSSGKGNGMCKSVSFHSNPGCTDKPGLTIERPAKDGRSYRTTERTVEATDLPRSVGCEITTCHKDCGTAECVVKDGKPQCQCPWGFVFNEAEKICDKTNPNSDRCASLDCGSNGGFCEVTDRGPECRCLYGLEFDEFDQTCYAPYIQTTVQLQLQAQVNGRQRSYADNVNFTTNGPAEQLSGTIVCTNLTSSFSLRGDTKISIGWSSFQSSGKGNGMCKSVSFHSNPGCTDKPGLTIARPAKDGGSYRKSERTVKATDLPRSVGCEITTCHKDCGAAECAVKDGKPRCECPWSLVFNEAEKSCRNETRPAASDPCKTGTLRCDKNSTCVLKNGQGMCQCKAGYTKTSGVCTAICTPACPVNAQCTVVGGMAQCQCKAGYKMDNTRQCTPIPMCSSACPANARCKMVQGTAQCQCNSGYKMDKNKCTPIPVCSSACPANARCKMVQGTAQCQCNSGYKMDKNKCTPIPVCSSACPANARCKMVQGTAQCQCKSGYKMDRNKCT